MDAFFFAVKRTHLSTLSFTRPILAPFGLTPARFDLMFALSELATNTQIELRKALGVARATLSEMLASLERLALIAKEKNPKDRRTFLIRFTEKGRALFRRVLDAHFNNGDMTLYIDAVITDRNIDKDEYQARYFAEDALWNLRLEFGDHTHNPYELDMDVYEAAVCEGLDDHFKQFLRNDDDE